MKSKLFNLVRCRVRGFCISAMFLLAAIPSVYSSSSAAAVEEIATGLNDPTGFRLDGNDVYFTTDNSSTNCTLKKVAKGGGSVTTLALAQLSMIPVVIEALGVALLWTVPISMVDKDVIEATSDMSSK